MDIHFFDNFADFLSVTSNSTLLVESIKEMKSEEEEESFKNFKNLKFLACLAFLAFLAVNISFYMPTDF